MARIIIRQKLGAAPSHIRHMDDTFRQPFMVTRITLIDNTDADMKIG